MRVIYRKICHARYLYIKRNVEKVWGARYTLGARYLSKNTVHSLFVSRNNAQDILKLQIGKIRKGRDGGHIHVLFYHFTRGAEENQKPSGIKYLDRD